LRTKTKRRMKLKFFYSLLALTTLIFFTASAQQTAKMTPAGTGFLEYLPQGYSGNSNKYPIVIALHGIKEKGNTLADVARVANVGLPKYVKYGSQYPFILISPQLKTTMGRWTGDYVMAVLNYVKTYLRVDPSRIYLTGLSLGGGGVWSVSTANPGVFAAILPICSGYNVLSGAAALANADVPIWGFHGDADATVSYMTTVNMVNAINNYKPSPLAKITIFPGLGHIIWDKVYKETTALTWLLSYKKGSVTTSPTPTNASPVANAGTDKTITLPTTALTITGSATDSDGTIASYAWTKKAGGSATLSGTATSSLSLSGLAAGTYTFALTVKDNKGTSDSDDVLVTVKSSTTNAAPIANAGADRKVVLPTTSTAITGSGKDSDGTIASYSWTKISGGSVSETGTTSSTLRLADLKTGSYTFRLTVKDNDGSTDSDDITVIVDSAPIVNAGGDRTVTLPLSSLTLSATATDDGTISSYQWSKYSGPILKMTNTTSKTVTLTGLYQGTYVIKLAVKDNLGLVSYDYVKIVVKSSVASVEKTSETELAALSVESLTQLPTFASR
jgi:hypothetical protein